MVMAARLPKKQYRPREKGNQQSRATSCKRRKLAQMGNWRVCGAANSVVQRKNLSLEWRKERNRRIWRLAPMEWCKERNELEWRDNRADRSVLAQQSRGETSSCLYRKQEGRRWRISIGKGGVLA